jgi:hypothetical protein
MDTLLTFESNYGNYTQLFTPNDWPRPPKDDRKIWHIIYQVPEDKITEVAELARSRNAGFVEMTDDDNPNPYDNVPAESYMQAAMSAVAGGTVSIGSTPEVGGQYIPGLAIPTVLSSDYTSVTLTWSAVPDALGYAVYQGGALVLELPPSLTRATVGMLKPGSSDVVLEVEVILDSDILYTPVTVSVDLESLPKGGSISNVQYKQTGDTVTYTADVLVPYAFVRLFIGGKHPKTGNTGGWPIDAFVTSDILGPLGHYKLVNYLVEGNDFYSAFYHYTGSYIEGSSSAADWTWTSLNVAPQSQSGYTYTWTVDIGGTDAQPGEYVVQGQGYAPTQNTFGGGYRSYSGGDGVACDDDVCA